MVQTLTNEQLTDLAAQYSTPLYVYNADVIKHQYEKLTGAFSGQNCRFFYACKALTNLHILRYVKQLGAGIDCSSINEVHLALKADFLPQNILYTSNGIDFAEIETAVTLGVNVNIDSLSNLDKFGHKYGANYPIGLRLRPNILAGGNLKISTGHDKSKFGIPVDQLQPLLEIINRHNLQVRGLHIHTGSEIKDVGVFTEGIDVLLNLVHHFKHLAFIDLGGGFKVPYKPGDGETDMDLLAKTVSISFAQYAAATGKQFEIWFEPGKYLVSASGYFLAKVNVLKPTAAAHFVSLNTGFNHLIRPMFYDSYHHIKNISNPLGPMHDYAVVGNICETDTFAWERPLNEVRENDLLVFFNAGAYGYEMSSNFNSRYKPAEVMVNEGAPKLIRRRQNFDDLLTEICLD
ncbi:MAG: diaminopimelate decarboxylase [Bacteroidetes bacterium]|nr:MAG: diaminopimelate decarboxylase [Bacteroidota bacterium]